MTHKHDDHELDQLADDIAEALHALPQAQASTGGAAPPALPDRDALAAQIRPHLTPEVAAAGLFGGKGGKPFNLAKFLENLQSFYNGVAPLISIISTAFGKPITLPPITVPTPPAPTAPQPS